MLFSSSNSTDHEDTIGVYLPFGDRPYKYRCINYGIEVVILKISQTYNEISCKIC